MIRPRHEIRSGRRAGAASRLALALSASLFVATLAARPSLADANGEADRGRPARPSGLSWLRSDSGGKRPAGLDIWGAGTACLALALAVCGGLAVAARRLGPRASAGAVQVVGRVSLSPKHSVYLLRVGRRVLVVGAGPQGPPALIAELDDAPQDPPEIPQGAES